MESPADENGAEERLFTGYEGRMLLIITGGSLCISMVALVIPPLLPTIIEDLGLTPSQAGIVMTVWWLTVALLNAPGGRLADRLSHKTGLVVGLALAMAGVVGLSTAGAYLALIGAVAIVGAGRGIYQPSAIGQISDLFVARRGQALGLRGGAFNLGGVLAGGLAVAVLATATWRAAFAPILVGMAVALALMHHWNREPYVVARVEFGLRETFGRLVRSSRIRAVVVALALYGFAWNGAISFLPAYLQFEKGLAPSVASLAFSGVFVVGAIVQPLSGVAGDRVGHTSTALSATAICSVGMAGLLLATGPALVLVALAVFAIGLSSFWPAMIAHGVEELPAESRAGDWGAITAVFLTAESLGSTYVGVTVEHASYPVAYAGLLACFLATMTVALWLSTVGRDR